MLPTSSPTKLWAHPRCLNGSAALRAAMCKNSFRAPLTTNQPVSLQTLLQAFHSNSIREPRTAPSVRWGNEPIPFRIRKTGAKPLVVGILKKANPCEPLSRVAMPACFLFSSPWLQSPPPNFHCIWFFNSYKWSFNWPPWEEVNQWVIEYDWRSNESYPSSFSNQGQLATNAMSKWIHNKFRLQKRKVNLTCLKSTQSFKSLTHYSSNWFDVVILIDNNFKSPLELMSNSDERKYKIFLCPALLSWQWQPVERWNEEIRTMKPLIVVSVDLKVKDITAQRERPL